jgi:uncharacterized protein with ParB-like and HNH nuclease domain
MKYKFESWTIEELRDLIIKEAIDLKPYYQRNYIWGTKDKQDLISSILKNYPLPSFFLAKKGDEYEMVDGQQRSKTIIQFLNGEITDNNGNSFNNSIEKLFLNYRLNFTILFDLERDDSLEKYYALLNKSGKHLNTNELNKAIYFNSAFLNLVEKIVESSQIERLNLFTEANKKRMNDRALIEELIATLVYENYDKRKAVDLLFKKLPKGEAILLEQKNNEILEILLNLNSIKEIKKTRYSQRNDFFTLYQFVSKYKNVDIEVLKYQYKILLLIEQYIKPTQDECEPLKNYALNCVTQSNSKAARENRLAIMTNLLANKSIAGNSDLLEVLEFLETEHDLEKTELINKDNFYLIDLNQFPHGL